MIHILKGIDKTPKPRTLCHHKTFNLKEVQVKQQNARENTMILTYYCALVIHIMNFAPRGLHVKECKYHIKYIKHICFLLHMLPRNHKCTKLNKETLHLSMSNLNKLVTN